MANIIYTVVKGDNLWSIARKYNTTVASLAKLNNIKDTSLIFVGQTLVIDGTEPETTTNNSNVAVIEHFGLQADTDRTIFATWIWDKDNTENYETKWYYDTGDNVWFVGNSSTTEDKQSIYNAPSNALRVRFKVKPISKKTTVNKTETSYWTAEWSTNKEYSFSDNPPSKPSAPSVEIKDYKLTATLDNIDLNATHIEFEVVKDNTSRFKLAKAEISMSHVSYSCTINDGSFYKVRCRSIRGSVNSEWSEYSENFKTKPAASSGITICKATSETSVYLEWESVDTADTYDIEYTTKKNYFDGSDQTTLINGIEYNHYEKTGLESGQEYFFRVRAVNDKGSSPWSTIKSIIIGKKPAAPTTWSSTTTVITGEPLTLHWMHNSEDSSAQKSAQIELIIDGNSETKTINTAEEKDDEKTMYYSIDTSSYAEGVKIQWRVRTQGVTNEYSDWSIQRVVDVYAPPTVSVRVTDAVGEILETIESLPFYIRAEAGPNTQVPVGYHISIISKESYETTDNLGNFKMVNSGDEVYSKHFDITNQLSIQISAGDLSLDNNITYSVECTVSMNSGLNAVDSCEFQVSWSSGTCWPNAEIGVDEATLTTFIRPYCYTEYGTSSDGYTLSVYRREFDGSFTELASGISDSTNTFITDPHPSLDLARYRIVAVSNETGVVTYYDVPGYPIGETAVVIQWDEDWSFFDITNEDEFEQPAWSGSMLKLPYNIDVSDDYKADVSMVEYIGRKHPVSYYGTQIGETAHWNVEIDKEDKETLYALRRLAVWMGDVYVREPSGSGYWANVSVSFSQKHMELTIPVKLDITRVAGGA